jgi:hypothetical protein
MMRHHVRTYSILGKDSNDASDAADIGRIGPKVMHCHLMNGAVFIRPCLTAAHGDT